MTSTITIRTIGVAAATVGLLTFAGACGTEAPTDGDGEQAPAAPAQVVQQGSPDNIERRLAAQVVVPQGSPDTIERRLAASRAEASCRVSTDTAERLGAKACAR